MLKNEEYVSFHAFQPFWPPSRLSWGQTAQIDRIGLRSVAKRTPTYSRAPLAESYKCRFLYKVRLDG